MKWKLPVVHHRKWNGLRHLRMTTKLFVAYVFLGMLPLLIFIGLYSYHLVQEQQKSLSYEKSTTLEQSVALLESRLQQTNLSHQTLQSNIALLDLLNGNYSSAAEELFSYNLQVQPAFTSILSDAAVAKVQVYRYQRSSLSYIEIVPYLENIQNFSYNVAILKRLQTKNTVWYLDFSQEDTPMLVCFMNLYAKNYSKVIGVLEIQLRASVIFQNMDFTQAREYLYLRQNEQYYPIEASGESLLGKNEPSYQPDWEGALPSLSSAIPNTDMELVYFYQYEHTTFYLMAQYLLLSVAFLLLPSLFFWRYSNRFTSELQQFSQHIRRSRKIELAPYEDKSGFSSDEFDIVVSEYNKLITSVNRLTQSVREAERLKSEANYYALTSQIHPHFLFNTLENIRMHIEIEDYESAKNMLFIFSHFLRYNISMRQESTLLEEVEHVRNYLLIHQYRQKNKILFEILLPAEIQDKPCPFCILQPIVENCLRHGQDLDTPLQISIQVIRQEDAILVEISDNGKGMTAEKIEELNRQMRQAQGPNWKTSSQAPDKADAPYSGGIGSYNVNSRLKYFYGSDYGLSFRQNTPQGTVCILTLGQGPDDFERSDPT